MDISVEAFVQQWEWAYNNNLYVFTNLVGKKSFNVKRSLFRLAYNKRLFGKGPIIPYFTSCFLNANAQNDAYFLAFSLILPPISILSPTLSTPGTFAVNTGIFSLQTLLINYVEPPLYLSQGQLYFLTFWTVNLNIAPNFLIICVFNNLQMKLFWHLLEW